MKCQINNPREEKLVKPAIDWMDSPKGRIQESEVRDNNPSGVHQLDQMWTSKVEASISEPIPPYASLTINGPVVSYIINKSLLHEEK